MTTDTNPFMTDLNDMYARAEAHADALDALVERHKARQARRFGLTLLRNRAGSYRLQAEDRSTDPPTRGAIVLDAATLDAVEEYLNALAKP